MALQGTKCFCRSSGVHYTFLWITNSCWNVMQGLRFQQVPYRLTESFPAIRSWTSSWNGHELGRHWARCPTSAATRSRCWSTRGCRLGRGPPSLWGGSPRWPGRAASCDCGASSSCRCRLPRSYRRCCWSVAEASNPSPSWDAPCRTCNRTLCKPGRSPSWSTSSGGADVRTKNGPCRMSLGRPKRSVPTDRNTPDACTGRKCRVRYCKWREPCPVNRPGRWSWDRCCWGWAAAGRAGTRPWVRNSGWRRSLPWNRSSPKDLELVPGVGEVPWPARRDAWASGGRRGALPAWRLWTLSYLTLQSYVHTRLRCGSIQSLLHWCTHRRGKYSGGARLAGRKRKVGEGVGPRFSLFTFGFRAGRRRRRVSLSVALTVGCHRRDAAPCTPRCR